MPLYTKCDSKAATNPVAMGKISVSRFVYNIKGTDFPPKKWCTGKASERRLKTFFIKKGKKGPSLVQKSAVKPVECCFKPCKDISRIQNNRESWYTFQIRPNRRTRELPVRGAWRVLRYIKRKEGNAADGE